MSALHEKIAHLAVLALFGRKDPRHLLPYVHPHVQRYEPHSAYPEHGAAALFARLAERRAARPAGRLILETLTATASLVAIGWDYADVRPTQLAFSPLARTLPSEGTFVLRLEPALARITHIWQMGDEVVESTAQPRLVSQDATHRLRGREALRMALIGTPVGGAAMPFSRLAP